MEQLSVLFIEPYDGGSHQAFRKGLMQACGHELEALTLPPRFWKWRMRGAAAWFADILNGHDVKNWDLLLVTDFINLADLRGLLDPPLDRLPMVLYMHENQLTYPLSPEEAFDFHFGFTNILSALASDRVIFNSDWHRELFLGSLSDYLGRMPEAVPKGIKQRLIERSEVLGVGLERDPLPADHFPRYRGGTCSPDAGPSWPRGERHLLLWNHRWEFDKQPAMFATVVTKLLDEGLDFDVALLGESRDHDEIFTPLRERLGPRCLAFGFQPDPEIYAHILATADIVVSCAQQEYFGISVAEAVHAGCYPVLPRSQVYPSLYGSRCKGRHFYQTEDQLADLLRDLIVGDSCGHVCSLDRDLDEFCWSRLGPEYDSLLTRVCEQGGCRTRGGELS